MSIRIVLCFGLTLMCGVRSPLFAEEPIPAKPKKPAKVEIGLPETLFQGVPVFLRDGLTQPFLQLMKEQTGINGDVRHLPDAMIVADQLQSGKLHLAVFQGHEFAWAKAKHKDLVPLVVVLPNQPPTQVYLLVRWNCDAKNLGNLKDEILTLPIGTKVHTKLFLDEQKKKFLDKNKFKAELQAGSVTDAIFDVIEKKATVTCVDSVGLEYFRLNNPGQFKNLKILSESPVFPQACVAVRQGHMDEATVKKFQETLLKAADLNEGKTMMTLWRLQKFERVPASYEQHLKECNKCYPFQGTPSEPMKK